jgi:hypothetical protein
MGYVIVGFIVVAIVGGLAVAAKYRRMKTAQAADIIDTRKQREEPTFAALDKTASTANAAADEAECNTFHANLLGAMGLPNDEQSMRERAEAADLASGMRLMFGSLVAQRGADFAVKFAVDSFGKTVAGAIVAQSALNPDIGSSPETAAALSDEMKRAADSGKPAKLRLLRYLLEPLMFGGEDKEKVAASLAAMFGRERMSALIDQFQDDAGNEILEKTLGEHEAAKNAGY